MKKKLNITKSNGKNIFATFLIQEFKVFSSKCYQDDCIYISCLLLQKNCFKLLQTNKTNSRILKQSAKLVYLLSP